MFARSLVLRCLLPMAILTALVIVIVAIDRQGRHRIAHAQQAVQAQADRTSRLGELRSISRALQRDALNLVTEADPAALAEIHQRFERRQAEFQHGLAGLARIMPEEQAYLRDQRAVGAELERVRMLASTDRGAALRRFQQHLRPTERDASVIADAMIHRDVARSQVLAVEQLNLQRDTDRQALIVSIALTLAALSLALWIVVATIVRPLQDIITTMRQLASGDAAVEIPHIGRRDAIGDMARSIEIFRAATRDRDRFKAEADATEEQRTLERARTERNERAARERATIDVERKRLSANLADLMEQRLSAVNDQLRQSAARVARTADDVARNATEAETRAKRTGDTAERVSGDLASITADTRTMASTMDDLQQRTRIATGAVRLAATKTRSAAEDVASMAVSAQEVGQIAELIRSVAQKANLLALNATIEAASAGEFGRSFGVVANEMKGLARQTAEATVGVDRQVDRIRDVASGTQAALAEIGAAVGQVEQQAALVDDAMRRHGEASDDMTRGVGNAIGLLSAARDEMGGLGDAATDAAKLSSALHGEAATLGRDADDVDTALRRVIEHLRMV